MPCYRASRNKRTDSPQDTRWQPSQDDFELLLNMLFQSRIVCFPTKEERVTMANQLNVTERQVQVWCQNKRQKLRESGIGYSDPRAPALVIAERGKVAPANMAVQSLPTPPKSHRKLPKSRAVSEVTEPSQADDTEYLPRATRTRTRPITPIELAPVSNRLPILVASAAYTYTPPPSKRSELMLRYQSPGRQLLHEIVRSSPPRESPIASSPPELSFDDDDEVESITTASEFSSPPPPSNLSNPSKPTWDFPIVTSASFQDRLATWAQNRFPEADLRLRSKSSDDLVKPVW
ncbi:hypothetical protein RSOLAG22IIIB_05024 [Rhizoctonia solani]|uniref:Homeobox domain-containing protein n=1 Tax=Rhizoctonia solani TaxID=456999 RepID=A0A0K6G2N1_9AGAM|nr:hypothetical protein RSOLAG22IIIB_05024 [Rhizoctonia solani]